jgi:C-8 sterol isomerase
MAYVFDPEILREIARNGIGLPRERLFDVVTEALAARYPGVITTQRDWFFNNAGGAMGTLTVLYASLTEYLIFFGTSLGTQGHTGRYRFCEDWFWILEGEMWYLSEGRTEREIYRAGDQIHLERRAAKSYRIVDNAWALEYARGFIPSMLPFGLADTVFSTVDFKKLAKTYGVYGRHLIRNLRRKRPAAGVAS